MNEITDQIYSREYNERLKARMYKIGEDYYFGVTSICDYATAKDLQSWMTNNTKAHVEKKQNEGKKRGSDLHMYFQKYFTGEDFQIPKEYEMAFDNFIDLVQKHSIKVHKSEFVVRNDLCGYAGQVDAFGEANGKPCILDWKTGKRSGRMTSPQIAAYRKAYMQMNPELKECGLAFLHVPADGVEAKFFEVENIAAVTHAFAAAFDMVRFLRYYDLKAMNWKWLGTKATQLMEEK